MGSVVGFNTTFSNTTCLVLSESKLYTPKDPVTSREPDILIS